MNQDLILMTILGMAVVTYIPRLLPVLFLSSRSLPPVIAKWLSFVPSAVLAAMLLPSIVLQDGEINLGRNNIFFWAAIPTILLAWKTRNLFATVTFGMVLVAVYRYYF